MTLELTKCKKRSHSLKTMTAVEADTVVDIYSASPEEFNFNILQDNLQNCLSIVDNEVMRNYIPALQNCSVVPLDRETLSALEQIQFFRISELVYQEDEFSVHKLATVFNALSSKPCTLVLMIQSDGENNNFYLGVRPRDSRFSGGTMRQLLEQSLLGMFPGSRTDDYFNENMAADLGKLSIQAISGVTCIADYKQDKNSVENKDFIQGLEKFIYSMRGKAFTAVCVANNLSHGDLIETRREYERIYTLMSPFANMQYNYALNNSAAATKSNTHGTAQTDTNGTSSGTNSTQTHSWAQQQATNQSQTITDTNGENTSVGVGQSHTKGASDGINDSETKTKSAGVYVGRGRNAGINIEGLSFGRSTNVGVTSSISRAKTHGTSHTDSVSDSISRNLTVGLNSSKAIGTTVGQSQSMTDSDAIAIGRQQSENQSRSISSNTANTTALSKTFGSSQAVTLNVQNKALLDTLQRLEKQLERLEECESIGMWDFAAYFLGESAAEAETAASMYRSLVSGNRSGLEIAAVNTWTDEKQVADISEYVVNFLHPIFLYEFANRAFEQRTLVDATALVSTNELAIQLGLPRKSIKGLPVMKHASFAQEVLVKKRQDQTYEIELGRIDRFGEISSTAVKLSLKSLAMHTFITGSTGAGKSNTAYHLLDELDRQSVKFLVVEPAKGEYKNIFGGRKNVSVYGTNVRKMPLLRLNPFSFPEDTHVLEHIDRLVEIFNACWPMYAAMPAVLKDAVERAYINCGWNLTDSTSAAHTFPTFVDLMNVLPDVVKQSGYSADTQNDYIGALFTRIKSLTNGINGQIFCSKEEISADKLFDENVIVDLSRVGSMETKSLLMGALVLKLQEHRMAGGGMNADLRHVTVLEEAHNLLRRTSDAQTQESSNLQGKSVEMIANAIAEMRTYGEGFIIADQAPGLMDPSVIRNTNTKIIMRLPDGGDRELVGKAASLNDDQIIELAKLPLGVAAVYQNDWLEPVLCRIKRFEGEQPYEYTVPTEDHAYMEHFFRYLFTVSEKAELSAEEVDRVKNWIDTVRTDDVTRRLLWRAASGEKLNPPEQKTIAYNLFEGKRLALSLERAINEETAVQQMSERIRQMHHVEDRAVADRIGGCIIGAVLDNIGKSSFGDRYAAFAGRGIM